MSPLNFVDAPNAPDTFNVLLYGPPKSGKTAAAATAPGPILWVNLEGGGALGYARKVAASRGSDIHEVRVEKDDQIKPILDQVYLHVRDGMAPKVKTVVIDTIGKVRDQLGRNIGRGKQPSIQQWGDIAKIVEGFVVGMRDLPVNVVFLAHQKVSDSDTGDRIVEPMIGGASTAKVCGEADVIAYCGRHETDDGPQYMGVLVEHNGRIGGDRSGGLGTSRQLDLSEWLDTYRKALMAGGVQEPAGLQLEVPA
ncbi:AAA family ATPase [Patulibacter minatonensis]|uniref:AAA family ATPase n=1 Tax=Patulibacter minatonensis TaxID=298163 RepID=UPI00047977A9|nr:AAA family ATPase [Patulibacter minatonensis]